MSKSILVIEDDEQVRILLKKMLENAGYSVAEAPNGEIGITMYRENPQDLVITDLIMPEKEGIETIRELLSDNPGAKIIAISGGGSVDPEQYLHMAERLGVLKTFAKPFRREEILQAVQELI
ncbi:response regulator [Thermodesulfobacteriota bacterium]